MSSKRDKVERLQQYLDGRLDPEEAVRVEEHLAADPRLRRMLDLLRAMRRTQPGDGALESAARGLIDRVVTDLHRRKDSPHRGLLTFDSGLLPLPAGIRPATLDSRRLRYAAEGLRLELSVYPASPGTFEVIGQIEGSRRGAALEVSLRQGRQTLRERTNPVHVFHFARVPEGAHDMTVEDPDGGRFEFLLEL